MKPALNVVDNVGVTFVNTVVGRGILNNVVNLSLGVCLFTPSDDNKTIDPDLVITTRLRMDLLCAKSLYETLGELLASVEKAAAPGANGAGVPEEAEAKGLVN